MNSLDTKHQVDWRSFFFDPKAWAHVLSGHMGFQVQNFGAQGCFLKDLAADDFRSPSLDQDHKFEKGHKPEHTTTMFFDSGVSHKKCSFAILIHFVNMLLKSYCRCVLQRFDDLMPCAGLVHGCVKRVVRCGRPWDETNVHILCTCSPHCSLKKSLKRSPEVPRQDPTRRNRNSSGCCNERRWDQPVRLFQAQKRPFSSFSMSSNLKFEIPCRNLAGFDSLLDTWMYYL